MADTLSTLRLWSKTASSNFPAGGTIFTGTGLAANLQQIQATVRQYLASVATPMASSATVDLSTADGYYINITGTVPITSFGTEVSGISYLLRFSGALTLTNSATIILPGIAITTVNGAIMLLVSEGGGTWRCAYYQANNLNAPLEILQNSQSADYTLVLADSAKHILHPSADITARTFTIPANASVAYPIGTALTFVNQNAAGVITIAITTDTMRIAGQGTTGNRTLSANGIATAVKLTATEWLISGTALI